MTRTAPPARRLAAILGASLLLTLVASPAVSAGPPVVGSVDRYPFATVRREIDPGPPVKFDAVRAWQTALGVVEIVVQVEHAYGVHVTVTDYASLPTGNIAMLSQSAENGVDTYRYQVTGLTPTAIYDYQVTATGTLSTAYAHGRVKG